MKEVKMTSMKRLMIFMFGLFLVGSANSPVHATEMPGGQVQINADDEKNFNLNSGTIPNNLKNREFPESGYVRPGTRVYNFEIDEMRFYSVDDAQDGNSLADESTITSISKQTKAKAQGYVECVDGEWKGTAQGYCFENVKDKACNACGECADVWSWGRSNSTSPTGDAVPQFKITEQAFCNGDFCFHEGDEEVEFVKTEHDHMYALAPGASGFLEMKRTAHDGAACNELRYVERTDGVDKYMMVPSKCSDLKDFLNNAPGNSVTVEKACPPATFELCADAEMPSSSAPPISSCYANGQYRSYGSTWWPSSSSKEMKICRCNKKVETYCEAQWGSMEIVERGEWSEGTCGTRKVTERQRCYCGETQVDDSHCRGTPEEREYEQTSSCDCTMPWGNVIEDGDRGCYGMWNYELQCNKGRWAGPWLQTQDCP